jgi:hypothetical protein
MYHLTTRFPTLQKDFFYRGNETGVLFKNGFFHANKQLLD